MALPRKSGLYALTSLQIGDIQSYVSRLFLLVAYQGLKLVFLVDNGPWTLNSCPSRPAELWQLLVYKSRGSPFANRLRDYSKGDIPGQPGDSSNLRVAAGQEKEDGWLSLLVALQRSCKEQLRSKKPPHGLYGCVAFEVAWSDVRGINYSNELQTDTCMSLEVKVMTKREFDSLEQARVCYDTILSGCDDSGPSLDFSIISNSKTRGSIFRRKASSNNLHGLGSDPGQTSKLQLDGSIRRKEIRKRKQADKSRSQRNGSCSILISELSRAYMSSLTSRFGTRLDPVNVGSLPPEYFTPPSSPYSEQVLHNLFKNCTSHQHKDSKKVSVLPDVEGSEPCCFSENRIHTARDPGESASCSGGGGVKNFQSLCSGKHSLGPPIQSFDGSRSSGCSRCGKIRDGIPFREKTQGCVRCSASAEVRPDPVYVHPDRLIAVAETYRDILIIFRFSEPLLPLELKRIITADRRLLKMLESGLPSWVIFLQSYPILSHIYRPWMRPLCGTVYYMISIVTVLIGFYDLYKNVPVLKATAAHICGPLFKWIEEWGMVSRLKYLGTMLFLQNCEKAFEWALAVTRASRQVSVLLMRPFLQPLMLLGEAFLPVWAEVSYGVQTLVQLISGTLSLVVAGLSHILYVTIWPFMTFLSAVFNLGKTLLYPIFYSIWNFLIFPIQLVRLVGNLLRALSSEVLNGVENLWLVIHDTFQLLLVSGSPTLQSLQIVKSSTPSPSIWRTLWNDILSKVFHAVNGIVKGLAAFIAACNRHRLSIYNQLVEFLFRARHMLKSGRYMALTTCQNIFWLPDPSGVDSTALLDEVESEAETQESIRPFSESSLMLRHRSMGHTSSGPLLLMRRQPP
ncbi:unnamed protein product [Calypogeia fissa]